MHSPIMVGSGGAGNGDCWPSGLTPDMFAAVVTHPVTLRPRRGSEPPRLAELPAGFLLNTGDHNPGFRRLLDQHRTQWRRLGVPLIISLAEGAPGDRAWMAERLEEEPVVAGIELPVREDVNLGELSAAIAAVRRVTTLPLLVKLPSTRAAHLAKACVVAGADALVIGGPPPAVYPASGQALLEGVLGGPIALPFTLRALEKVAALALDAALIASGGIQRRQDVALCLNMGATAVQVRSLLWTDPAAARALAQWGQDPIE
ncbi:MAG: hypothetical protein GXP42_07925 [Chloroflexi bacterium]|nr:hypothetical protein [Chloroflexota bacterium]